MDFPFFDSVPTNLADNLEYRLEIREWALKSESNQRWLMAACKKDVLYWLATFCWVCEPRKQENTVMPFIPWPRQVEAASKILDVKYSPDQGDVGIEKSRGEGATYLCLAIVEHDFIFAGEPRHWGVVSRNLPAADNVDDPGSLMSMIDWQFDQLPTWMIGRRGDDFRRKIADNTFSNYRTGSTIVAYACTGDLAAGLRKSGMLMDEMGRWPRNGHDHQAMSASEPVTDFRMLVSTYKGADGAYYDAMSDDTSSMTKVVMAWQDNPTRNRGLYEIDPDTNLPRAVDPVNNPVPQSYIDKFPAIRDRLVRRGFDMKRVRSPWYDTRCLRPGMTPRWVAQEYDRDASGSDSLFFNPDLIDDLLEHPEKSTVEQPLYVGNFRYDSEDHSGNYYDHAEGIMKLWVQLGFKKSPPPDDYVMGIDISAGTAGTYSSNSTISCARRASGRKVMSVATPRIGPEEFADLAIALAMWFRNADGDPAFMIWEANGCGQQFTNRVLSTDFNNFFMRETEEARMRKRTKKAGFWTSPKNKRVMLGEYQYQLAEDLFVNPDKEALEECKKYIWISATEIEHRGAANSEDPSGAKSAHGDRCYADALCAWGIKDRGRKPPRGDPRTRNRTMPANCARSRQIDRQRAARNAARDEYPEH